MKKRRPQARHHPVLHLDRKRDHIAPLSAAVFCGMPAPSDVRD
jgi:hypothetical protein